MKDKFLELNTIHDIYAKSFNIAQFISPSKKIADIENLRDKIYSDLIRKSFRDSKLIKDNKK